MLTYINSYLIAYLSRINKNIKHKDDQGFLLYYLASSYLLANDEFLFLNSL